MANYNGRPKKYHLPHPWSRRYAMVAAQARHRKEEWAFDQDSWYKMWEDSGVMEHYGRQVHQYCMVRKDPIEAWGPHNCIIVSRRKHFKKSIYENMLNWPKTDWRDDDGV